MGSVGRQDEKTAIQQNLDQLNAAADNYLKLPSGADSNDAKYELYMKASRLSQTVRGPVEMVFEQFENMARLGSIRTLLEAGVFHAVPTGGESISAEELSEKTGMDKKLIEPVRLMRALTPLGPFQETGFEQYAHTPFSEIYTNHQISAVYKTMADEFCAPMLRNYEFLQHYDWKNAITLRSNPFTWVHDCQGMTMFEYMSKRPTKMARFSDAMIPMASTQVSTGIYPFAETLRELESPDRATIVDVGGGRGHMLRWIREGVPELKGQFILQDRANVIADNGEEIRAHGIEPMVHDFFTPQPVKGALVYYMRQIVHDWPDEPECRRILENLAAVMDPEKSRVLISEYIVPEIGTSMHPAWMDQTMMTFGGIERTEKDFAHLLDISGLELVKTWRAPGVPVGVVEARLKPKK